jgi:hypothetical protein
MTAEPGGDRPYGRTDGRTAHARERAKAQAGYAMLVPAEVAPTSAGVKDGAQSVRPAGCVRACVRAYVRTKATDRRRKSAPRPRHRGSSAASASPRPPTAAVDLRLAAGRPTLARGLVSPRRVGQVGRPTGQEINSPKCKTGVKRTAARCRQSLVLPALTLANCEPRRLRARSERRSCLRIRHL